MKIAGRIFVFSAVMYYIAAIVYWWVAKEVIGTTVIGLTGGMATIVGFYMLFTQNRLGHQPEDAMDAEIHEADAEYGFFSPHSWWPLPVGLFAGVTALGLIFAAWLLVLGIVGLLAAVAGWLFEYYRGDHVTW